MLLLLLAGTSGAVSPPAARPVTMFRVTVEVRGAEPARTTIQAIADSSNAMDANRTTIEEV